MNERMFVSDLRKTALRQFIVAALTAGIAAPKAEVKAEADFQGQTRSIDYFILPASAAGEIASAFGGDVEVLLQRSQVEYRAPEYRAMDVVSLEPQTLANPDEVSDADAEAAYDKVAGKDPALRLAREARPSADPLPERSRGGRRRGKDQGRRELRRHRQGAEP